MRVIGVGVPCLSHWRAPDFERLTALFSQHARVTRVTPEGVDHLDVNGFAALVRELLELGAFTSFCEHELARSARRYGRIFHIASAYETRLLRRICGRVRASRQGFG